MAKRAVNFCSGPSTLNYGVLEEAAKNILEFNNSGMGVLEVSHRSKDYQAVVDEAEALLRELMGIPANYKVLFVQGGASLQFAMLPMNILPLDKKAQFVITGTWGQKALEQVKVVGGNAEVVYSSESAKFNQVPRLADLKFDPSSAYIHITGNETIQGVQFHDMPNLPAPVICDSSSEILCRPVDVKKFACIYAGVQKNLGPSGMAVVIIREDLIGKARKGTPTMLDYQTYAKEGSLYNTPSSFCLYVTMLSLRWLKSIGGPAEMEKINRKKAGLIYGAIDQSNGFYKGHAKVESRSIMNLTFTLTTPELEKEFVDSAKKEGFTNLAGHRSVGGCRASIYNALPLEGVERFAEYMGKFKKSH
jgi:phosphoserine aminotransferase